MNMKSRVRSINDTRPLREIRPQRNARTWQEDRDKDTASRTDIKVDAAHQLLVETIAPRIQSMSFNAATVDRRMFFYFQRKHTGRRCSCYTEANSPNAECPICLGVGVVGGYEKFGTITEIIDFTSPNLTLVNVEPNLVENTRPVFLTLQDGCENGYVEAVLPLRNNKGKMDTFLLAQPIFNKGTKILAIDPNGSSAVITNKEDLNPFLAFDRITIRIEFERRTGEKPVFSHFLMRYEIRDDLMVHGDLSRAEENLNSNAMGIYDAYAEIPIFFDGKTANFQTEDILIRINDMRRFKITRINENRVATVITSFDVNARYLIPSIDKALIDHLLM